MSTSVSTSFVKQYERDFKHVFQREGGILRQAVRVHTGVVGSTDTFQVIGKGTATTKARHGMITPMNQGHTAATATLVDRYAGDYVDKLDESKINIDERMAIAQGGAYACGRAIDNDLFTAMDGTTQTAVTFTMTSIAAVRGSLLLIAKALDANDVPNDGNRYCALTPNTWAMAGLTDPFSSRDYAGDRGLPFVDGQPYPRWRYWMGINWTMHTGLPNAGAAASAKAFAWHKNAVGYAIGDDVSSRIDYVPERGAHFVNNMFSGGAVLIDDTGVIEITIGDDTTALPAS